MSFNPSINLVLSLSAETADKTLAHIQEVIRQTIYWEQELEQRPKNPKKYQVSLSFKEVK